MSNLNQYDEKGNYTGPRGEQYLKLFICHGCQSCWELQDDDTIIDRGPHFLTYGEVVTDKIKVIEP